MELESYSYLVDLLKNRFNLVCDLEGKTIRTIFEDIDDWIVILSTENEILPYHGRVSCGDIEFYCEDDTDNIFGQIARKILHTAEYVEYRKAQEYRNEYKHFISAEEFQKVCDYFCKDRKKVEMQTEKVERDRARQLLAKYPDLLSK